MNTSCPPEKTKVLLIEDEPIFHEIAEATMGPHCTLLIASTIEEGLFHLKEHDDIGVLILDGRVPLSRRDLRMGTTVLLAEEVLAERGNRIVLYAASGDAFLNAALVGVGARATDKSTAYAAVARQLIAERRSHEGS